VNRDTAYLCRDLARFYDWTYEGLTEDVPSYLQAARDYGAPLLELACGTGRLTVPLARAGFTITGLDLSPNSMANRGVKLAEVEDPVWHVIVADSNACHCMMGPPGLAYPEMCAAGGCGAGDWANCPSTVNCSDGGDTTLRADPEWLRGFTRRPGGSNLGFLDGHAIWMKAESILAESPRWSGGCYCGPLVEGKLKGLQMRCWPTYGTGGVMPADYEGCDIVPLY
jgi:prepilin-type processing-associated H-X9-DG protein